MPPRTTEPRDLAVQRMDAVRRGEPGAWEALVDDFGGLILAIARRAGLSDDDCRDVYQETWISLLAQLQNIRDPGALAAWIAQTARRQSWFLRNRQRHEDSTEPLDLEDGQPEPAQSLASLEEAQLVRDGIKELGETCRALLAALFLSREALSYEEIAERLGRPAGSIGPTRQRCLIELARVLERHGLEGQ